MDSDFKKRYYQNTAGPTTSAEEKHILRKQGGPIRGPFRIINPVFFENYHGANFLFVKKSNMFSQKDFVLASQIDIEVMGQRTGGELQYRGGISLSRKALFDILIEMEETDRLCFCMPRWAPEKIIKDIIIYGDDFS